MYAEETEYFRTVCFYYYTDNYTKVHHSGDIPVEFNVDEDIYDSLISEAN
jgi:cytochrome c oxidase assembly protein Cox11